MAKFMGNKPTPANAPRADLTAPPAGATLEGPAPPAENGAEVNAPLTAHEVTGGPTEGADPNPNAPGLSGPPQLQPAAESADLDRARDDAAEQAFRSRRTAPGDPGAAPAPPPAPPTTIPRATIDEALAARRPGSGPRDLLTVTAVPHVQKAAVAMDQVAHRSDAALRQRGYVPADVRQANGDDFAVAERLMRELEDALLVVEHMVETTRGRLSAAPSRPPSP